MTNLLLTVQIFGEYQTDADVPLAFRRAWSPVSFGPLEKKYFADVWVFLRARRNSGARGLAYCKTPNPRHRQLGVVVWFVGHRVVSAPMRVQTQESTFFFMSFIVPCFLTPLCYTRKEQ